MKRSKSKTSSASPAAKNLNAKRLESENRKLRQTNEKIARKNQELELISQCLLAINSSLNLDEILITILESIRKLIGVVGSSIWLTDKASREVVCRQAAGFQRNIVKGWRLAPGEGIAGWVSSYGESVILADTRKDRRHFHKVGEKMRVELRSIISVPMRVKGEIIGALQLVDKKVGRFDSSHEDLLEILAEASAIAIDNARLYEKARLEANDRKKAEMTLRKNETRLKEKKIALEEANEALNVLLRNRKKDKAQLEDQVVANIQDLVLPFVAKLSQSRLEDKQSLYVDIIKSNLSSILSPFLRQMPMDYFGLTPTEIRIADLVRKNKTTKEIAQLLDTSVKTIEAHRNRLRKKLGLTNQRVQLRDYLSTLV